MTGYIALLPEIFLFISSLLLIFFKKKELTAFVLTLSCLVLSLFLYNQSYFGFDAFNGFVFISRFSQSIKILILFFALVFFLQLIFTDQNYDKQFATLVVFSVIGMMLVASSANLLSLYIALELQSLPLYVLSCIDKKSTKSSEAGVKYFALGILSSAIAIYGISVVYSVSGSFAFSDSFLIYNRLHIIGLIFFVSGLLFKLAIVPFHTWIPDIYEGAPTISVAFFGMVSKFSVVAALVSVFTGFHSQEKFYASDLANTLASQMQNPLLILSSVSILFGALSALGQNNIKRFIAFASVVHAGYILLGVASSGEFSAQNPAIIYLTIYSIINVGIFSFLLVLPTSKIDRLSGFGATNKLAGACFAVLLLSSAGIPPFAGFFSKLYAVKSLIDSGFFVVALFSVLFGVIAAFYYLKIIITNIVNK